MTMQELVEYINRNGCLPRGLCNTAKASCADQVSAQTAMMARAANRTAYWVPSALTFPGLAAGATAPTFVSLGFTDTLTPNGMWRCVHITDIVSSGLTSQDDVRVDILVSGIVRSTFFAGRFARGNANDCTPACGISICAGPGELIVINLTNVSGAALGVAAAMTVETRTAYSGEDGFCCEDSSCVTPSTMLCGQEVG